MKLMELEKMKLNIGSRVKEEREKSGLTQIELASKIGRYDNGAISRFESGQFSIELAVEIDIALGTSIVPGAISQLDGYKAFKPNIEDNYYLVSFDSDGLSYKEKQVNRESIENELQRVKIINDQYKVIIEYMADKQE